MRRWQVREVRRHRRTRRPRDGRSARLRRYGSSRGDNKDKSGTNVNNIPRAHRIFSAFSAGMMRLLSASPALLCVATSIAANEAKIVAPRPLIFRRGIQRARNGGVDVGKK